MDSKVPVPLGEAYPELCISVGLSCENCTRETARQLAAACKGLRGSMITQLFVQIYPDQACGRMGAYFSECYRKASPMAVSQPVSVAEQIDDRPAQLRVPLRKGGRKAVALASVA